MSASDFKLPHELIQNTEGSPNRNGKMNATFKETVNKKLEPSSESKAQTKEVGQKKAEFNRPETESEYESETDSDDEPSRSESSEM